VSSTRGRSFPSAILFALLCACAGRQIQPPPEAPRPPVEPPRVEERPSPLVVGLILPGTGSAALKQYGDLIKEGVDLAVREHQRAGGREVEIVVVDDGGDPARARQSVAELESRNAVGIIGPLLGSSLEAAGRARSDSSLVIISPTSSERAPSLANVYTLNAGDTRGAEELGTYAARRRLTAIGVLYPRTAEFTAQARAFQSAATAAGIRVTDVPYDPGTTTFARPLQQLKAASAGAVFIPASERDIRQLAPQLEYYGLTGIQVLGSEAWVSDEVLRRIPPRQLEGVVAATPLYRASRSVAWEDFVGMYENTYRRTLDNPYPALGFDAASLILSNLPRVRGGAGDVSRGIARVTDFRGATGVLSTRGGIISRRPFIVRIEAGRPVLQEPGS
jgi:branched-chain amino acid transport system substrate-binding protein